MINTDELGRQTLTGNRVCIATLQRSVICPWRLAQAGGKLLSFSHNVGISR
ncbi:hypothetical protein CsatB_018038 [Cannabis sativa]